MVKLKTYWMVASIPHESFSVDKREARLPCFPPGTAKMNDERKFKCDPADADKVLANFGKAKTPLPLNYAHGKDPVKGHKAAGKLLECIRTQEGGIDFRASLTPTAMKEISEEEWFGTSARFSGWEDDDGYLHPEKILHLSLTNEPAIDGQDGIQIFSMDPYASSDCYCPVCSGTQDPGQIVAAITKMMNMPVGATNDEIVKQVGRLFASGTASSMAATQEESMEKQTVPPDAEGAKSLNKEALVAEMQALSEKNKKELMEFAKTLFTDLTKQSFAEFQRADRIKKAVDFSISSGKVTIACRGDAEKLATANVEAFEAFVTNAPVLAPVHRVIKNVAEKALTQADFSNADLDDPDTRLQLHEAAIARVTAKTSSTYEDAVNHLTQKDVM